jgi:rubrerythrin
VKDLLKEISDEEHRHQCEVRQHLKWRSEKGLDWYRKYISTYGFGSRKTELLRDVADQWAKGNRGQKGEWK